MRWLLACLCFWPVLAGAADLHYSGEETLWQDTVWDGRVTVDGILTVAPGVTLEIRPGSEILFTYFDSNGDGIGEHELFIQGRVLARGRVEAPIRFAAEGAHRPGAWGAINLMASDEESQFEQVRFEDAYRGFHGHFARAVLRDCTFTGCVRGAQFQESQVTLERCRLAGNRNGLQFRDSQVVLRDLTVNDGYWGVRGVQSQVDIDGCRIEKNLVNGINLRDCRFTIGDSVVTGNRRGLYLQRSQGRVAGSRFEGNSEHGILLEQTDGEVSGNRIAGNGRSGIKCVETPVRISGNQIVANGEYALSNDGAAAVAAPSNWWGTTDTGQLARLVRDGADLAGRGPVELLPVLTEEPVLFGLPQP